MSQLNIKTLRESLGLTQEELAQKIGVSRNTIINYEKGGVIPESKKNMLATLAEEPPSMQTDSVSMPREVFDQITRLTETVLSQQLTIENLSQKGAAAGAKGVAPMVAHG